jgi:ribosomal protein S18 acetylase RimI-like enzyme
MNLHDDLTFTVTQELQYRYDVYGELGQSIGYLVIVHKKNEQAMEITGLWVDNAYRRRGIAKYLMSLIISSPFNQALGVTKIIVNPIPFGNSPVGKKVLIGFFELFNFTPREGYMVFNG